MPGKKEGFIETEYTLVKVEAIPEVNSGKIP